MKKLFKKFLSVLLIYRMLFTTSAFITFADALNNEETTTSVEATEEKEIADAETTEVEETTTLEETAETEEVVDEETTVAEDTNVPEETTEVEEVVEEKSSEELLEEPEFDETTEVEETSGDELVNSLEESTSSVELESSNEETTEETVVEESTELEETVVLEATESEITKEEIFTAGENYVFKFTMPSQGIPAWFNKIDGPTDIEYNSSDLPGKRVVVPVVYIGNYSGSLAEVYIRVGWRNGGPSGPWCSDEQIDSWVAQWNAGPISPFDIWANLSKVTASSVKTNPNRTSYSVGKKINSTGLVLNLSGVDFENIPVAYDKPEFEYLFSYELRDENKNPIVGETITADTKYVRFHFNGAVYEDVEITIVPPTTFTFTNSYGYFDGSESKTSIEYKSNELETKPIKVPIPYLTKNNGKFDLGWNDGTSDLSDSELSTFINSWKNNPASDVTINVKAYDQSTSEGEYVNVSTPATKTTYYVGNKFDPKGLAFEAFDDGKNHKKIIKYDDAQYKRLFDTTYVYLDSNKDPISTNAITLETKYVGVKFNNIITPITEVTVSAKPQPSPGGGGSGGGGSSGGAGHVSEGVIVNAETNVSSVNNIPQNNLLFSRELAYVLLVSSENINKHISKVTDQYGNEGYGVWLKYPGTALSWFFLSGDIAANGQNGTSGFLKSGAYYLEWEGQYNWYNFNENGLCFS